MRILGIDPGYATIGYGIIDYFRGRFSVVGFGAITTKAGLPFEIRLRDIYNDMNTVIEKYKPDDMSIEKLYFNTNSTTAIDVAQAPKVLLPPKRYRFGAAAPARAPPEPCRGSALPRLLL